MDAERVAYASQVMGESARARMLVALLASEGLPARALAHEARISPQTASWHLSKLLAAGLVGCERRGRHRCYRLRTRHVAYALEALEDLAPHAPQAQARAQARSAPDDRLHAARTCYDHLGGAIAVALAGALVATGWLVAHGADHELTFTGSRGLRALGVNVIALRGRRRAFARACPDWSARGHHVGGAVGSALLRAFLERGWILADAGSRAVLVTAAGREGLATTFGVHP
jgi:DNA-binding transcriptional ArsR family regulator